MNFGVDSYRGLQGQSLWGDLKINKQSPEGVDHVRPGTRGGNNGGSYGSRNNGGGYGGEIMVVATANGYGSRNNGGGYGSDYGGGYGGGNSGLTYSNKSSGAKDGKIEVMEILLKILNISRQDKKKKRRF